MKTDHKSLEKLLAANSDPPPGIQRWMPYLQPYDYNIFYIKQDPVAAHYSSNYYIPHAKLESHSNTAEQYVKMITEHAILQTVTKALLCEKVW